MLGLGKVFKLFFIYYMILEIFSSYSNFYNVGFGKFSQIVLYILLDIRVCPFLFYFILFSEFLWDFLWLAQSI
jgi:hypothetical protein